MRDLMRIVDAGRRQSLAEARVTVWSGATITVLHNPSRAAFENFRKKFPVLRGLLSYSGHDLYLWNAGAAVHPNIIQELGLEHVDCIFYIRGRWQGDVYDETETRYKPAIQRLTPYQPPKPRQSDEELLAQLFGDDTLDEAAAGPRWHRPTAATILVVVHPGSAAGSADFNLGEAVATKARQRLIAELVGWRGGVIVIDGVLSAELGRAPYRPLGAALAAALQRARDDGLIAVRQAGEDPAQTRVIRKIVARLGLTPATTRFAITGAWIHSDTGGGCVGSVQDVLTVLRFQATVLPSAVDLD